MNYLANYYKNLSEQLQYKVNNLSRLLNEVENPFRVDSPISTELGLDPNMRHIGGVTPADFNSARESTAFNPHNSGWQQPVRTPQSPGDSRTWAQIINDFFRYWNNTAFWADMWELQEFLFDIDTIEYDAQGNNIWTEEQKQIFWELLQNMVNAANGYSQSSGVNLHGLISKMMHNAQSQNGGSGPIYFVPFPAPYGTNWYALVGNGGFPTSNPWNWSPGQPLPFKTLSNIIF